MKRGDNMTVARLKTGDRVQYAARFLQSIGCYGGDTAFRVGTVVAMPDELGLPAESFAYVRWDDTGEPSPVNRCNLAKPGSLLASDAYVK